MVWHSRKQFVIASKGKNKVTIWPSNSIPRHRPKRTENTHPSKNLYPNVHSSITHTSQKVEPKGPPTDECANMMIPYNGILNDKKKWIANTCYDMEKP